MKNMYIGALREDIHYTEFMDLIRALRHHGIRPSYVIFQNEDMLTPNDTANHKSVH